MLPNNIQIQIEDNQNKILYDVTQYIEDVSIQQYRKGQASKLIANFNNSRKRIYIPKGSVVSFKIGDVGFFKGYVMEDNIDNWYNTTIDVYDQLRYLAINRASYNINATATQILQRIASDFGLEVDPETEETSFVVGNGNNVHTNESLLDIITHALKHTLVNTRLLYNLRDNFGKLTIVSPSNMVASKQLAIGSNVINFEYSGSINQKTYNKVKLYYSNEYGMDFIGQSAEDLESQKKWGVLQYYGQIDEMAASSNVAGAQNLAKTILASSNREFRSIRIDSFGDSDCMAGAIVFVNLGLVNGKDNIFGYQLIDRATHNFFNNEYKMSIEVMDVDTLEYLKGQR